LASSARWRVSTSGEFGGVGCERGDEVAALARGENVADDGEAGAFRFFKRDVCEDGVEVELFAELG